MDLRAAGKTREAIAGFGAYYHGHHIPVTLTELHSLWPLEAREGLTDAQREALMLADEMGYLESSRKATLKGDSRGTRNQPAGGRIAAPSR